MSKGSSDNFTKSMPAKPRHVVWAPRSKRDLADVWRYYARVASIEVADKLLREINEAAQRLSNDAHRWRARDELMPGLRSALVPLTSSSIGSRTERFRSSASCMDVEISWRSFPIRNAEDGRSRSQAEPGWDSSFFLSTPAPPLSRGQADRAI